MKQFLGALFRAGLVSNAWLTRRPLGVPIERAATRFYVRLTQAIRGARRVPPAPEALGAEWERLLGARKWARVVSHDETTAYGEISSRCPLRGTGDVDACHRLMGYDRGLLAATGAQLVVLRSQAEPGVTTCQVAIRSVDVPVGDLVPAHVRARRR